MIAHSKLEPLFQRKYDPVPMYTRFALNETQPLQLHCIRPDTYEQRLKCSTYAEAVAQHE